MSAMVHASSHRCHWCFLKIMCGLLLLWAEDMDALADFSKYLTKIISSHSAYGCDGEILRLQCPRHSTVTVLSAHYGLADIRFCPSLFHTTLLSKHSNSSCSASTALQKLLSECQGHRDCHLLVNHHVFGRDPCPGNSKYLQVTYKCKPTEHKRKVSCEGETVTLHCKHPRVLIIYSAVYGRQMDDHDVCRSHYDRPPYDCLFYGAAHTVSKKCYGKQRCSIPINDQTFRDPCPPRTTKYLTILYSCVPQVLLKEAEPNIFNPTLVPQQTNDSGIIPNVRGSKLPEHRGFIVSNSLMIYGYIREHQDKAALLFITSVCVGLLILLLAVSLRVSCHRKHLSGSEPWNKRLLSKTEETSEEEEDSDDDDDDKEEEGYGDDRSVTVIDGSLMSEGNRKPVDCWEEVTYTTEAAELMERIERRELVIQEIWMNSYLNGTSCGHL